MIVYRFSCHERAAAVVISCRNYMPGGLHLLWAKCTIPYAYFFYTAVAIVTCPYRDDGRPTKRELTLTTAYSIGTSYTYTRFRRL